MVYGVYGCYAAALLHCAPELKRHALILSDSDAAKSSREHKEHCEK